MPCWCLSQKGMVFFMKQFFNILKFEFGGYLKNKLFIVTTLLFVTVVGVVLSYPRISDAIKTEKPDKNTTVMQKEKIYINDMWTYLSSDGRETHASLFFAKNMPDKEIVNAQFKTEEELKQVINNGEAICALIITGPAKYTYIVKNVGMFDTTKTRIDELMKAKYQMDNMKYAGISTETAEEILSVQITGEIIQTGKDQAANFFYTYVVVFAMYMAVLLYGQFVAQSVASEKSSRAMELLITSANPNALMFGKVIAAGFAGLLQLVSLFGGAVIFYNFNKSFWADNYVITSIFNMPAYTFAYALTFFVLGYFVYSFLYGATGSLVSRSEDINTAVMPVTLLFIAAFFVVIFSMVSGNVDSGLMVACSYIPFTSSVAMFTRIAMGEVKPMEIAISIAILVMSCGLIGWIAAKIYRVGVLLYGKTPKLSNLIEILREK